MNNRKIFNNIKTELIKCQDSLSRFHLHLFYSNKRLPLLLVVFVIIISILWTLISNFQESGPNNENCINCVDIKTEEIIVDSSFVEGIVDLNSEDNVAEQVDEFISSFTPIEPDSE